MSGTGHSGGSHHHHTRFYIVVATIVVVAIVGLLILNDDSVSFTGAAIEGTGSEQVAVEDISVNAGQIDDAEGLYGITDETQEAVGQPLKVGHEVEMELSFDKIPAIRQDAALDSILLEFDDLSTTIRVNNERLELNNLQEVSLVIDDFDGQFDMRGSGFSLDGVAKTIEFNGVKLQSDFEMSISFDNLKYDRLEVSSMELSNVDLPAGDGEIKLGERLTYSLDQDKVRISSYKGAMVAEEGFSLDGDARGISVSGTLLDLSVK